MTSTTSQTVAAIHPEAVPRALAAIPADAILARVVELFGALADPTRARILYALDTGELCVRDLALVTKISESAVSHQLSLLRGRRLVKSRRAGTVMYYSLDDHHLPVLFREAEYHADHIQRNIPDHPYP